MPGPITYKEVVIANGAALSDEADVGAYRILAIQMPASWTTANLTFKGRPGSAADVLSHPNDVLQDVYDDAGNEVTVLAAAGRYISLTANKLDALLGVGALKVRSGTTGTPVNQGAARTLTLVLVPIN